jgi:cell wall-associated NlpC family hydrolase
LAVLAALVVAVPAQSEPSVRSKQAEAQRVLEQIHELDSSLSHAIEAYNLATEKLADIKAELKVNTHDLGVARRNLGQAQRVLERRVVELYTSDQDSSTLSVLLGARSLDDLLNRVETANRVSDQDTRVLRQVTGFRQAVETRQKALVRARTAQTALVSERASRKASIESQLSKRQRLLSSIKSEIARIQAAERARAAALERQARARLVGQLRLQRQSAAGAVVGASATTPEGVTVAPTSQYGGVVGIAMQYLGVPYVWGGASPSGFDCSGFAMYVYAQVGVSLPHHAASQYGYGVPVSRDQLEPGDLVFFNGLGHMGIYIGGGQFIHAPHTGDVVKISSLSDSWYAATWVGARRIV